MNDTRIFDLTVDDADEARILAAMDSLRPGSAEIRMDEPASLRAQGRTLRRQRSVAHVAGVAAAAVVIAALGFRGIGDDAAQLSPASPEPMVTSSGPPQVFPPECPKNSFTPNTTGMPPAVTRSANELMALVAACDEQRRVARFIKDYTGLEFEGHSLIGDLSYNGAMRYPDEKDRYELIAALLSFAPTEMPSAGDYMWPATPTTEAEWQRLVALGVLTPGEAAKAQAQGQYRGPYLVIPSSGRIGLLNDGKTYGPGPGGEG